MRTATVTKIKGLSIQTQQNTFVLFTLFKLTLDECKTLTKISTRKPFTTIPQTSARFGHEGTRKPAKSILQMAQCPGGLAQWTQTPPTSVPCAPQTVLPLHQPLPERLTMPYQQVVQPPKKPMGRGVTPEPLLPQIKLLPWVVRVHRTVEDLTLEGGEAVADPSVTPEVCRRRQVHSHHVRRAICPPGQCQVFNHQWHRKEPSLSEEVGQGLPSAIPCDWWQNFAALVGRRT